MRENWASGLMIVAGVLSGECMRRNRSGRYEDLGALFREWRVFQRPRMTNGVPDYTSQGVEEQQRGLAVFQKRLAAIDTRGWSGSERIDWELVRAEMNGLEFDHRVLRPWARDPASYGDPPLGERHPERRRGSPPGRLDLPVAL